MNPKICPVCHTAADVVGHFRNSDKYRVMCPKCGGFLISGSAAEDADTIKSNFRWFASAWLVHNRPTLFDTRSLEILRGTLERPSLGNRTMAALRYLCSRFKQGENFTLENLLTGDNLGFVPSSWSKDDSEARFILTACLVDQLGFVSNHPPAKPGAFML